MTLLSHLGAFHLLSADWNKQNGQYLQPALYFTSIIICTLIENMKQPSFHFVFAQPARRYSAFKRVLSNLSECCWFSSLQLRSPWEIWSFSASCSLHFITCKIIGTFQEDYILYLDFYLGLLL